VIPGFINAHTHVGDSFAKDRGLNLPISELVEPPDGLKHKLLRTASKETIISGIKTTLKEMFSSGITSFVDFRESGEEGVKILKEALIDSPINAFICGRPFPDLEVLPKVLGVSNAIGLSSTNKYSDEELR
jgi:cytosine/adenosine deaminase-related metal-dependent hydrolase